MNKVEIVARFLAEFQDSLQQARRASESARAEATDEESRAEGKYDTRGLEASYLAAGQAERTEELIAEIGTFKSGVFRDFKAGDPVAPGALVKLKFDDGEISCLLLAPCGGGMTIEHDGLEITLLAPGSPIRKQLTGMKAGQSLSRPPMEILAVY